MHLPEAVPHSFASEKAFPARTLAKEMFSLLKTTFAVWLSFNNHSSPHLVLVCYMVGRFFV